LARHPSLFTIADLWGLGTRRLASQILPGAVVKQSEHINFFGLKEITLVAEEFGLEMLRHSIYEPTVGVPLLEMKALGVLFKKR